jgi:hypothetical protein
MMKLRGVGVELHASTTMHTGSSLFRPRWMTSRLFSEVFLFPTLLPTFPRVADGCTFRPAKTPRSGLKPRILCAEVAIGLGVSNIETDVLLTCDSVPILFIPARHRSTLSRIPSSPPPYPAIGPSSTV